MHQKLSFTLLALIFTLSLPRPSWAETVVEKVVQTGVLTAGTRTNVIPYSYIDAEGKLVGYSIDVLNLIKEELEKELGKPITLELVEVGLEDRIPKLDDEEVDIVCENVRFSWEREEFVDFSLSYNIAGIKLLVKTGSTLGSPDSLAGKRIAAEPKTIAQQAIELVQPQAIFMPVQSFEEALSALKQEEVDAIAGDEVVLEGMRQTLENPDAYEVVPQDSYAQYGIACMVPEGNSEFLDTVNYAIVKLMQGDLTDDPRYVEMLDRWFGPEGITNVDPSLRREFFKNIIITREEIPPSEATPEPVKSQ